jgi:competence CoiA-like predicted nuclease
MVKRGKGLKEVSMEKTRYFCPVCSQEVEIRHYRESGDHFFCKNKECLLNTKEIEYKDLKKLLERV